MHKNKTLKAHTLQQLAAEVDHLRERVEDLEDLRDLKEAFRRNGNKPLIPPRQAEKGRRYRLSARNCLGSG